MKPVLKAFLMAGWITLTLAACTGAPKDQSRALSREQHAQCLVCKRNADLACLDVVVEESTPRYEYDGTTYFFCSDECRAEFARNPTQFLARK